jgi:hypothetical protein
MAFSGSYNFACTRFTSEPAFKAPNKPTWVKQTPENGRHKQKYQKRKNPLQLGAVAGFK